MARQLPSWNDGEARTAILDFVDRVTHEDSADYVPPAERIAVFDNDGTLWCEKPMPVELGFILARMAQMAEQDRALRERQPFKAAYEHDHAWLGNAITKHYQGDHGDVKILLGGVLQAFAGWTIDDYQTEAGRFVRQGQHPQLGRTYHECGYLPMVELLRHLEDNGFATYIASGGDRDFMRTVAHAMYGIPSERVIGSSNALRYQDGTLVYQAEPDVFDDGPVKPVRIWSRVGARPIVAGGNSNGDLQMLEFSGGRDRPALRLLVLHDDAEREFAYEAGAEEALERARADGWTIASIRDDWATVFAEAPDREHAAARR
jgi:hypothetical protein